MAVWQFAATACVCYLHHDGHPQGVFSYVVFALLARSAATFGVFCPVQLVGVSVRHDSPVMEKDCVNPWVAMTLLLVSAAVVTATEINARPEITEAKPACACAHTAAANVARGLTLSGVFFFKRLWIISTTTLMRDFRVIFVTLLPLAGKYLHRGNIKTKVHLFVFMLALQEDCRRGKAKNANCGRNRKKRNPFLHSWRKGRINNDLFFLDKGTANGFKCFFVICWKQIPFWHFFS